jgi:hypothetical protein
MPKIITLPRMYEAYIEGRTTDSASYITEKLIDKWWEDILELLDIESKLCGLTNEGSLATERGGFVSRSDSKYYIAPVKNVTGIGNDKTLDIRHRDIQVPYEYGQEEWDLPLRQTSVHNGVDSPNCLGTRDTHYLPPKISAEVCDSTPTDDCR